MASTQTKLQGHSSSIQHRTSIPIHWHQHGIHTRIEYIPNAINPVRIQSRSLDSITGITECFNVKLHLQQQRCGREQSKQCDWQQNAPSTPPKCNPIASQKHAWVFEWKRRFAGVQELDLASSRFESYDRIKAR
eukprot:38608_1